MTMFRKLAALFKKKKKEPYWNDFFLKNIDEPSTGDGFGAIMQNIKSEGVPFDTQERVRTFVEDILPSPAAWDATTGKLSLNVDGEKIQVEIGTAEQVTGVTVTVKCLGPPRHAAQIANAIQRRYQLKISGWGNNPYVR